MGEPHRPHHPHDAYPHPKDVQQRIGRVLPDQRTPRQHDCVSRIEGPHKEEGTVGTKPAHQREADDSHDDACHLDGSDVAPHRLVQSACYCHMLTSSLHAERCPSTFANPLRVSNALRGLIGWDVLAHFRTPPGSHLAPAEYDHMLAIARSETLRSPHVHLS